MRGYFVFIVAISLLSLFATVAHAQETVAAPGNFYGQEIQKVIDYLRSIGLNDYANNTELFFKAGKIIVKPLSGALRGENNQKGGPVYLIPSFFNPPPKGFDPKKPSDVTAMMDLATTLTHEKYHSENHEAYYRAGNNMPTKGGTNNLEYEGWVAGLTFLDDVIKQTLDRAKDKKISKQEKEELLDLAKKLLDLKIQYEKDYEDNKYGPPIYTLHLLEEMKKAVEKELNKLKGNESQTVEVGSLIDSHNKLEEGVREGYAEYMKNYAGTGVSNSQEFALRLIEIANAAKNRPLEEPVKLYLVLNLDIPSDIGTGTHEFLLNYRPQQKIKVSSGVKPEYADYALTISQSVFTQIYMDKDPVSKTREIYNQGKFSVVELEPEQAVIEKDLDSLLAAYKNIDKIPSSVRGLVKNERVNFMIDIGDSKKVVRGIVFSDEGLESVKGGLSDPAIEFSTTKNVFKNIRDAHDKPAAVAQALNDGSIEYKALKTASRIKLFGARGVSKFVSLINKGTFKVEPGEKKQIVYAGQDATLEGYPNGLNVVVIPGNRDSPVVDSFGTARGYINSKIQTFMQQQPQAYSRNAGVYQYRITAYENHWQNVDYEPLVPTFATSYSSRDLMASAYNGRVYAKVGGLI